MSEHVPIPGGGVLDTLRNETEEIGVILVHGIGEQRRFDHLDGQARFLIRSLGDFVGVDQYTVTINPNAAAGYRAQSDTWAAGSDPSVTICIRHHLNGRSQWTKLQLHEVWWADVNESYSLAKQFRFWLWALSVWNHPGKHASSLPTAQRVVPPTVPFHHGLWDRVRLFGLSTFFSLLGMSLGLVTIFLTRLFNIAKPELLEIVTNYVSAVKLYNQRRRFGSGLWWAREEFLDAVGEPPRVSIRRRMIRTLADVACKRYTRWYVLAHSLGSVVAFNGLMETAYAWPGYLDVERWQKLVDAGLAGPAHGPFEVPTKRTMPARPAWVEDDEIAYRSRIFARFGGFLTYGSPLEKFAGLWPALVPISREPAFGAHVTWINLLDPLDPISGPLLAFEAQPECCCPRPRNVGYCASWWLLLAHIKYLAHRRSRPDAALAALRWLITGNSKDFNSCEYGWQPGKWIAPKRIVYMLRTAVAVSSWLLLAGALACLAAFIVPALIDAMGSASHVISSSVQRLAGVEKPIDFQCGGLCEGVAGVWQWLTGYWDWNRYWSRVQLLVVVGAATTAIFGLGARALRFFQLDKDDRRVPWKPWKSRTIGAVEQGEWVLPSLDPPQGGPVDGMGPRPPAAAVVSQRELPIQ